MNGRRGNGECFGEKQTKGRRKKGPGEEEEEGEVESEVRNAKKTLVRVEKKKNREDECMVVKEMNEIGEKNLNGPRKKKSHTFR